MLMETMHKLANGERRQPCPAPNRPCEHPDHPGQTSNSNSIFALQLQMTAINFTSGDKRKVGCQPSPWIRISSAPPRHPAPGFVERKW